MAPKSVSVPANNSLGFNDVQYIAPLLATASKPAPRKSDQQTTSAGAHPSPSKPQAADAVKDSQRRDRGARSKETKVCRKIDSHLIMPPR